MRKESHIYTHYESVTLLVTGVMFTIQQAIMTVNSQQSQREGQTRTGQKSNSETEGDYHKQLHADERHNLELFNSFRGRKR
jgi:hypothetical protein